MNSLETRNDTDQKTPRLMMMSLMTDENTMAGVVMGCGVLGLVYVLPLYKSFQNV